MIVTALIASTLLDGCGATQNTVAAPESVQHGLPASFQAKLTSPQSRLRSVSKLPITTTDVGSAKNILYIAPAEQYAIVQFRAVWDKLLSKPVIVWTGTTVASAKAVWKKEGYKGDPLPAINTFYVTRALPTPDSYHRKGTAWQEEPGVMPDKDVSFWIGFFN